MSEVKSSKANIIAIAMMFALFFMIAFVTNFAGSMGVIVKNQFNASNGLSQLGSAANFIAYLFMGIPGGLILKRKGYKFTAITATTVGFLGVGVQLASGYLGSFGVYVAGAFIAGFSMCLLNVVVNPMLTTLGGGGNRGNQLVQFGGSLNSIGGTIAPILLGYLIGGEVAKAQVADAAPALMIAMGIFAVATIALAICPIPEPHMETAEEKAARLANGSSVMKDIGSTLKFSHFTFGAIAIFLYIINEVGIPNMANLYMTKEGAPGYVGAVVAGSVVAAYWFSMMIGRLLGGIVGGKVSARAMLSTVAMMGIAFVACIIYMPDTMVKVPFAADLQVPLKMCMMVLCGLCTSVMWGGIFSLASAGLGQYVTMGSGIFMTMVCGGLLLPVQGVLADKFGILNSYWLNVAIFAYILLFALVLSKNKSAAKA